MTLLTRKTLISTIAVATVYAASLILVNYFLYIIVAMTLTILVIWKFYFEVKLNVLSVLDKIKFLVLPLIFNLGALYLTTLFFQSFAKIIISLVVAITNYFLWLALRKVHNLTDRAAIFYRNVLIVISFVSVFFGSTAIFRLYMLLSTSSNRTYYQALLVLLVFVLFYVVSNFLTWENGADEDIKKLRPYNIVNSLLGAEIAWVSSIWIVNYPVIAVSEKANLGGTPLPAILLTIVFYYLWGIIFHKLDGSLTRRVLTEYVLITIVFILVLLVTARWLPVF